MTTGWADHILKLTQPRPNGDIKMKRIIKVQIKYFFGGFAE